MRGTPTVWRRHPAVCILGELVVLSWVKSVLSLRRSDQTPTTNKNGRDALKEAVDVHVDVHVNSSSIAQGKYSSVIFSRIFHRVVLVAILCVSCAMQAR